MSTNPAAVMFLSAEGVERIVTPEARKMCAVWNEGLPPPPPDESADDWRLPSGVRKLLQAASIPREGVQVPHPRMPDLAVHIYSGCTPAADGCLVTFVAGPGFQILGRLTGSERRVALLVTEGLRNDEIAQRLNRSRRTVEFQLNAIYRKLDISNRTQLARALL